MLYLNYLFLIFEWSACKLAGQGKCSFHYKQAFNLFFLTEILVVTRHQREISAVVSQTSFRQGETSAGRREMSASFSSLLASSLVHSGGGAMDGYLLFVEYLHEKENVLISKTVQKNRPKF